MSRLVPPGDPKAIKKYSAFLAVDTPKKMYWSRFMGKGKTTTMPLHQLVDLEKSRGDEITFDLSMQMTMEPVEGADVLEGKEEDLQFYSGSVKIDKMRGGAKAGDEMSQKRTVHDMRKVARARQSEWWARVFDELCFMYAAGARGTNADFVFRTTYTGFAGNPFSAPDSEHLYVANKKAKATLTTSDTINMDEIELLAAKAETMGGGAGGGQPGSDGNTQTPQIQPIKIGAERHYVLVMSTWQAYDLRTSTDTNGWMDVQKALTTAVGRKSNIFTGGLGMKNNVVLHSHRNIIKFTDYGSGGNVEAHRALFLGAQALVCAFGNAGIGLRFKWHEEWDDRGDKLVVTSKSMFGVMKTQFNGKDFGVVAYDTACADRSTT